METLKTLAELIIEKGVVLKEEDQRNLYVSPKDYEIIINEIKTVDGLKVRIDANFFIVDKGKVLTMKHD